MGSCANGFDIEVEAFIEVRVRVGAVGAGAPGKFKLGDVISLLGSQLVSMLAEGEQ